MNKNKIPYLAFDNFVLRTPLFPVQFYKNLTDGKSVKNTSLKEAFSNKIVQEAVFLASPSFYFEIEKWTNGELDPKKEKRLKLSLLKYLARMSSRCTPFGLFAGCSLGDYGEKTRLILKQRDAYKRHTRPDMNYLVALSQDLAKLSHIKQQLTFYPNSSLYKVGEQLRYIEYFYVNSSRQHHIVEIDNSSYLQAILEKTAGGATLTQLAQLLVDDDTISTEEAYGFLDELLDSQVLVSALEPSVSGPPFVTQLLSVLENLEGCQDEIDFLKTIAARFYALDKKLGNVTSQYLQISDYLKNRPTTFELKFLFQTDLELSTNTCELNSTYLAQIKKAMVLFNRITPPNSETNLSRFQEAFYERYEGREMPLTHVLDVETGIGYLQDSGNGDVNPLIDDLMLPLQEEPYAENSIKLNKVYRLLLNKLLVAREQQEMTIQLKESDFEDLPLKWDDLPDTLSGMIELIGKNDSLKIKLSGFGGSSAANLLGRFCHEDSAITQYTQHIIAQEKSLHPKKILAEIVHLPEARVGNILMRPNFREYEIPYLAQSNLPKEQQIALEDLFISVKHNRIFLRSKKHNKEVIPHLTNAHNFSANALPIYQFLCDLQTQGMRGSIVFNFGPLNPLFDFFPRVEFGNIILHEAKWRVKKEEIKPLLDAIPDNTQLLATTRQLRKLRSLPCYVMLTDGDNELLVNLDNLTAVKMLLETVKNRAEFILTEFLHHQDSIVTSSEGHYANQIVVSFYNQGKSTKIVPQQKVEYGAA